MGLSLPGSVDLGGKLGSVDLVRPRSFVACNDIVASWGEGLSRAHLARLCDAAIGLCLEDAPAYRVETGDPIAHGGRVFDWLVDRDVSPTRVYEVGPAVIAALSRFFPTEVEVTEAQDFSGPAVVSSTG